MASGGSRDNPQALLQQLVQLATQQQKEGTKDRGPMDYSVDHAGRKIILPGEPSIDRESDRGSGKTHCRTVQCRFESPGNGDASLLGIAGNN